MMNPALEDSGLGGLERDLGNEYGLHGSELRLRQHRGKSVDGDLNRFERLRRGSRLRRNGGMRWWWRRLNNHSRRSGRLRFGEGRRTSRRNLHM